MLPLSVNDTENGSRRVLVRTHEVDVSVRLVDTEPASRCRYLHTVLSSGLHTSYNNAMHSVIPLGREFSSFY